MSKPQPSINAIYWLADSAFLGQAIESTIFERKRSSTQRGLLSLKT
jgi:hypothetical protein